MCSAITIATDIYEHPLPRNVERVVDGMNKICELVASETVMTTDHKESDMSETTNDQHIKIYTADG